MYHVLCSVMFISNIPLSLSFFILYNEYIGKGRILDIHVSYIEVKDCLGMSGSHAPCDQITTGNGSTHVASLPQRPGVTRII